MNRGQAFKQWVKRSPHPAARAITSLWLYLRTFTLPPVQLIYIPAGWLHRALFSLWHGFMRICYWTPSFRARIGGSAERLYLYNGMPQLIGPLNISIGHDCSISGHSTLCGRWASQHTPALMIGNDVAIGWQTSICVGNRIVLGDRVKIAGQCMLAGYPGHPLAAEARARGLPDDEDQVGDVIIENDVWLGTGVKVLAGVHIGRGAVIAAGSVVTRDIPANVLAAGVPARPVRSLCPSTTAETEAVL